MIVSVGGSISPGDIDDLSGAPRVAHRATAAAVIIPGVSLSRARWSTSCASSTLTAVQRAVACQQPIAEQTARAAQRSTLDETMLVRDQDLLDIVGMTQHEHIERTQPDADDVAIFGATRVTNASDRADLKSFPRSSQHAVLGNTTKFYTYAMRTIVHLSDLHFSQSTGGIVAPLVNASRPSVPI